MAKGHQAYRDSWATFLVKNALPEGSWQLGQFFIDEDSAEKCALRDVVKCQLPHPAYTKLKTTKKSSKAKTAFSRKCPAI